MSIKEIEAKAKELQELKRMREELDAEITTLEDAIKASMGDAEQITAGAGDGRFPTSGFCVGRAGNAVSVRPVPPHAQRA